MTKNKTKKGLFKYRKDLTKLARKNRKQATKAESLLWNLILKNKKLGFRFLRQKPIDKYIVDFYCSKLLTVIELDGYSHTNREEDDLKRQKELEKKGLYFIRYPNELVEKQTEGVFYDLKEKLSKREKELNQTKISTSLFKGSRAKPSMGF